MSIRLTRLLSFAEYRQMADDAVSQGYWRNDRRIFTPGMGWTTPFYFDPLHELPAGLRVMIPESRKGELGFLSVHYWRDWSNKRAPLTIVCPNGETWEVDRKSSNGDGWSVSGEWPNLTCSPSIVVPGYHGFLQNGTFTEDLDGRGPVGIVRPIPERPATEQPA